MKLKNNYKVLFYILVSSLLTLPVYSQTMKPIAQSLNISGTALETEEKPVYKKIKDMPVIDDIGNKMLDQVSNTSTQANQSSIEPPKTELKVPEKPPETKKFEQTVSFTSSNTAKVDEVADKPEVHKPISEINQKADQIDQEIRNEEQKVLKDLRVLWSAAIERSTTIRLAIQKLSNPNEAENMKDGAVSKLLSPLANLAPLAAMASSSVTQTAGALFGGSLLDTFSDNPDKQYNRSFVKVSDFDLVMLSKAVDELQGELVVRYYDYKNAIEKMNLLETALKNSEKINNEAKSSGNFSTEMVSDAFYREAIQNYQRAKQNYLSARTALEQITGNDAIVNIENPKDDTADTSETKVDKGK